MPYSELVAATAAITRLINTIGSFLLVLGIYGLSIQYNAPILRAVAVLEAALIILNETTYVFLIPMVDFNALMAFSLGFFTAGAIISIIFGIALLRFRGKAPQPEVFGGYGLVKIFWPLAYFMLALLNMSQLIIATRANSLILGILGIILFFNEHRRGPIILDGADWLNQSQIWE